MPLLQFYISHGGTMGGRDFNVNEIINLAPDATAITFIPVKLTDDSANAGETVKEVLPLEAGQKNAVDNFSGVEIVRVEETEYGLKIVSKPYGSVRVGVNYSLCNAQGRDVGVHAYTTDSVDRTTGELTSILGAYTAEDIAKIKSCGYFVSYSTSGYALDEANAVTLPLA